jgi:hypothetical protein
MAFTSCSLVPHISPCQSLDCPISPYQVVAPTWLSLLSVFQDGQQRHTACACRQGQVCFWRGVHRALAEGQMAWSGQVEQRAQDSTCGRCADSNCSQHPKRLQRQQQKQQEG